MKKTFLLLVLSVMCIMVRAEYTDLDSREYMPYLKSTALQPGTTGNIDVCVKFGQNIIGTVLVTFDLPDGITINDITGECGHVNYNPVNNKCLFGYCDGLEVIAHVNVTVDADMPLGDYEMTLRDYQIVEQVNYNQDYKGDATTKLTIQRAQAIEVQDENYPFKVTPFVVANGSNDITVQMKNQYDVASFKLTVQYPEGIAARTGRGVSPTVINDNLYSTTYGGVTPLSISQNYNQETRTATYTVSNSEIDTYLASDNFFDAFTLPISVDASTASAVSSIKVAVSDIVAYNTDVDVNCENPIYIHGGEYMFSVFVGNSTGDVILYGIYDDAAKTAAMSALKGGSVDITQTNLDESFAPNDVLVYDHTNTRYARNVKAGWGSICLPFAVDSNDDIVYYTMSAANNESITLQKVNGLDANEPGFFKANAGDRSMQSGGYNWARTAGEGSELNGLTLTGCYETTNLASGAGYYISGGKLYADGATIKPFRSYIAGSVANGRTLSILVDDETGLHDITSQLSNEDIYNLMGVRQSAMQRGVNIVGGKKILVK